MGAHGEGSPDLLNLIRGIVDRTGMNRFRVMGFDSPHNGTVGVQCSTIYSTVYTKYMSLGVEAIRGTAR